MKSKEKSKLGISKKKAVNYFIELFDKGYGADSAQETVAAWYGKEAADYARKEVSGGKEAEEYAYKQLLNLNIWEYYKLWENMFLPFSALRIIIDDLGEVIKGRNPLNKKCSWCKDLYNTKLSDRQRKMIYGK